MRKWKYVEHEEENENGCTIEEFFSDNDGKNWELSDPGTANESKICSTPFITFHQK